MLSRQPHISWRGVPSPHTFIIEKENNPRLTIPTVHIHIPTWVLLGDRIRSISTIQITMTGQIEHWWLFTLDEQLTVMNSLAQGHLKGWFKPSEISDGWDILHRKAAREKKHIMSLQSTLHYIHQYTSNKFLHIISYMWLYTLNRAIEHSNYPQGVASNLFTSTF